MRIVTVGTAVLRVSFALGLPVRGASGQDAGRSMAARVDAIFREWNRTDGPGCAVAAVRDGKILFDHAYGMANLEHSEQAGSEPTPSRRLAWRNRMGPSSWVHPLSGRTVGSGGAV